MDGMSLVMHVDRIEGQSIMDALLLLLGQQIGHSSQRILHQIITIYTKTLTPDQNAMQRRRISWLSNHVREVNPNIRQYEYTI